MFKDWSETKTVEIPMITEHLIGNKVGTNHIVNLSVDQFLSPPKDWQSKWNRDKGEDSAWTYGSAKNLTETIRRLNDGDPTDVLKKAYDRFLQTFKDINLGEIESTRRRKKWNADDGEVDVDRAIGGQDYLNRKHRKKAISRIVHIGFQSMFSCYFKEDTFAQGAAGAVALANVLETAGYRVRISALYCHRWTRHNSETGIIRDKYTKVFNKDFGDELNHVSVEVEIKTESMQLDENMLLAWGLSGAGRHFDFTWQTSLLGSQVHGSMGMSTDQDYTYDNFPHIDLMIHQDDHAAIATKVVQFIKKDLKGE